MLSNEKIIKNFQTVQDLPVAQVTGIAFGYLQAISEAKEKWGDEFEDSPLEVQEFVIALEQGVLTYKDAQVVVVE